MGPRLVTAPPYRPRRRGLSPRTRFEVFKRDAFTCQYCGRQAPDVILNCDHLLSVAQGGDNDILNLITSCRECNDGKGVALLSDTQRKMLATRIEEYCQQMENSEIPYLARLQLIERILKKRGKRRYYQRLDYLEHLYLHGASLDEMEARALKIRRRVSEFEGPYDAWLTAIGSPY